MKAKACKALCLFLSLLSLLAIIPTSVTADSALPDTSDAAAVYFYHVESDTVVHAQNESALLPAASTVKLLSGLLFCEQLADRLDETVTVTKEMLAGVVGHRSRFLKAGVRISVRDLLYCALCASYNDAYRILAIVTAGSTKEFVSLMNARAKEIGATESSYQDLIGTSDSPFTTASELALIARTAYQNPLYMLCVGKDSYYIQGIGSTIYNRNEMIEATETNKHFNAKCNGMSVGSTTNGGDCIVASASNGKESYICVILGCAESETVADNQAYILANSLINYVYHFYTYLDIVTPDTVICTIPVTVSDVTSAVEVKSRETISYYLPSTAEVGKDVRFSIRLTQTELEAPVAEGTFVGYVAVLYGDRIIGTAELYTAGTAERSSLVSSLKAIQSLTKNRAFLAGAICFLLLIVAWITTECLLTRHRHRRWDKYFSHKIDTTKGGK
jgi:D-alanyl-D-alanine carboxypeptidase (penicillin-binding protein 5/6)